ncbi:MAG TPA: ATP-binding protein [Gaiellaceae bacterium]|jgi:PAS domain S-box-containing protein|nr:ATP-binding protein [Gaiellaceae bacterium]
MPHAAAPARPEARSGRPAGSPDRALIDAALAVNEASDLEDAFDALVVVGRELLDAERVSVAVWDEGLAQGVIRAAAGVGADAVGAVLTLAPDHPYRRVLAGETIVSRSVPSGALDARLAAALAGLSAVVVVPFAGDGGPLVTFQAGWRETRSDEELESATEMLRTLGTLTRVAYRTERERIHRHERARFEAVLDAVADGVVVRTSEGIALNSTARRLLELEDAGPLEPPAPVNPWGERPLTPSELLALLAVETPRERRFRYRVALPSGRGAFLDGTVAPILEPGGRSGSVALFRDVTLDHNREFLTEQLLERLFDSLPVAITVAEPGEREVLSVNGAFLRLIGYPEEEVVGAKPPYDWVEAPGDVSCLSDSRPEHPFETLFRHKDGRLIPVQVKRFEIPGADGNAVAVVALITDLSEQRRFEQQLAQSGKLATIGELAAGVAHEINNPLFAILGLVEFLLKESEPGTKAHDRLLLVHQTGLEIKEIVRALLDFAREPSEERAGMSVRDAAHETVELFRRTSAAKGIELTEAYGEEPTPVFGSPNQLKQIFLNLITNASQALAGEGHVEVAVHRDGDWVVAAVSDDGRGIPEDALGRIFEPFFTTKRSAGGSGLGLSVSHGIAAAHGGSLTAENRPEGGARFTLRLPVKEAV